MFRKLSPWIALTAAIGIILSACTTKGSDETRAVPSPPHADGAEREALSLDDLLALKKAVLEQRHEEFKSLMVAVRRAGSEEVNGANAFLKLEAEAEMASESHNKLYQLAKRVYEPVIQILAAHGTKTSIPVIVTFLASDHPATRHVWPELAQALASIAGRHGINKEMMDPLFESPDEDLAAFARELWDQISHKAVSRFQAKDELPIQYQAMRTGLEELASGKAIWINIAAERGFDVQGAVKVQNLRSLIDDCGRRLEEIQRQMEEKEIGYYEAMSLKSREQVLMIMAVEQLVNQEGGKAFDFLVHLLETGEGSIESAASYHLSKLTGEHMPFHGIIHYGNLAAPLSLKLNAAAGWKDWREQHGETLMTEPVASPGEADRIRSRRIAEYRRTRFAPTGQGEFARPADELITELVETDDRKLLEMLVEVLRRKTLTRPQIERLIEEIRNDDSEPHRNFLLQVLFTSQDERAKEYLLSALGSDTDPSLVLQLFQSMEGVQMSEVPLVTHLYKSHPSPEVKDVIVRLAVQGHYSSGEMEGRDQLIDFILDNTTSDEHTIMCLDNLYRRAGTNERGRRKLQEAADKEASPTVKIAIYRIGMGRRADEWLTRLLRSNESEKVRLAGLDEFCRLVEEKGGYATRVQDKPLALLRHATSTDPSPEVRKKAGVIVDLMRKRAVRDVMERMRGSERAFQHQIESLKSQKGLMEEKQLQYALLSLLQDLGSSRRSYDPVAGLKRRFGDVPEAAEIQAIRDEISVKKRQRFCNAVRNGIFNDVTMDERINAQYKELTAQCEQ
ncbi:hypothetical protein ACFLU6_09060 [Acidobacteriota bacterium]